MIAVQSQQLQVLELPHTSRDLLQAVVVQTELFERAVSPNESNSLQTVNAQCIVGQREGLQAGPHVTKREGGEVTYVVVLEAQILKTAWQVHWCRGEAVVGKVQVLQRSKRGGGNACFTHINTPDI